jgi:hypothetical protein
VVGCPKPVRIRDDGLRAYVRRQRCLLADEDPCTCGPYIDVVRKVIVTEAAHVKSLGSGGSDPENLVPLCSHHHRSRGDSQHGGIRTFEHTHRTVLGGRTLKQIARVVDAEYRAQPGAWPETEG